MLVVLPTVLSAAYFYGVAADQYESEARFIVRSTEPQMGASASGLGQMLGLVGGVADARAQSLSVDDYLKSHDAVAAIGTHLDLVGMFRRPGTDWLSRLWWKQPSPEDLLQYYRRRVTVDFDTDTGITTLRVHAFRPADARRIAQSLLLLGEARVNAFNERAVEDSVRVASSELARAEQDVVKSQQALTRFRVAHRDIDPQKTSANQLQLVGGLEQSLAQTRAELAAMPAQIDPQSPQVVALGHRIAGLEAQLAAQSNRLTGAVGATGVAGAAGASEAAGEPETGAGGTLATQLAAYEELLLKEDFAAKRYSAVATALETAREQALRQQLYVVRVVEPNEPVKSLYPRSTLIVASVFFLLLLAYGIGWLIAAGVREHAA